VIVGKPRKRKNLAAGRGGGSDQLISSPRGGFKRKKGPLKLERKVEVSKILGRKGAKVTRGSLSLQCVGVVLKSGQKLEEGSAEATQFKRERNQGTYATVPLVQEKGKTREKIPAGK